MLPCNAPKFSELPVEFTNPLEYIKAFVKSNPTLVWELIQQEGRVGKEQQTGA